MKQVATHFFFGIATYVWLKQIIKKEKYRTLPWFYPAIFDWTEADLNAILKSIVIKGQV